jgi:hypothetical protein
VLRDSAGGLRESFDTGEVELGPTRHVVPPSPRKPRQREEQRGSHECKPPVEESPDHDQRNHLRQGLGLDLDCHRESKPGEDEVERQPCPEPERARQHPQRQVDRERYVGSTALHLAPELRRQSDQEESSGEHPWTNVSPEEAPGRCDERCDEQAELCAQHADVHVVERVVYLRRVARRMHVQSRDRRPPEWVVRHTERHIVAVGCEQTLVQTKIDKRGTFWQPDTPGIVQPR